MREVSSSAAADSFLRDLRKEVLGASVHLERREAGWALQIGGRLVLVIQTLWRLIGSNYICVTSEDDGHQFGLPKPVDALVKVNGLLTEKSVIGLEFDPRTGDLKLHFDGAMTFEVLTSSSGYESWTIWHDGEFFAVGASGGLV